MKSRQQHIAPSIIGDGWCGFIGSNFVHYWATLTHLIVVVVDAHPCRNQGSSAGLSQENFGLFRRYLRRSLYNCYKKEGIDTVAHLQLNLT